VTQAGVIEQPGDAPDRLDGLASLPGRERVLLADPCHFAVTRQDNPHTTDEAGHLHDVDAKRARDQWRQLKDTYESLGFATTVVEPEPGLPDLVFCRNTAFPYPDPTDGEASFIPGCMRYEGRRGEIPVVADHLQVLGYRSTPLPDEVAPSSAAATSSGCGTGGWRSPAPATAPPAKPGGPSPRSRTRPWLGSSWPTPSSTTSTPAWPSSTGPRSPGCLPPSPTGPEN
jgi:hypothetical protein